MTDLKTMGVRISLYIDHINKVDRRFGHGNSIDKYPDEKLEKRIGEVAEAMGTATGLRKVKLAQKKLRLETEQHSRKNKEDHGERYERYFVDHARAWGEKNGITRAAWRAAGVPAKVLDDQLRTPNGYLRT